MPFLRSYLYVCLLMSVLTFVWYAFDKWRATRGGKRVPETTLHLLELLGGWPGGCLGRSLLRHKSSKASFVFISWLIAILHITAILAWRINRG